MNAVDSSRIRYWQDHFKGAAPQSLLRWAVEQYGDQLVVVTSLQFTGIVTLHMMKQITDHFQVLTLDTGLLFPETQQLIEAVERHLDITIQRIKPQQTLAEQAHEYGDRLWETKPDLCCHQRKTLPLERALAGYQAWVTGLRRDQSSSRANIPVIDWDDRYHLLKFCPFVDWTQDMLWTYIQAHGLPYNALHDRGYKSIGCHTCTVPAEGRAGRWRNFSKTECGIHVRLVDKKDT